MEIQGQYAYLEYLNDTTVVYARMLYNHQNDPEENLNVADQVPTQLIDSFSQKLNAYRHEYNQ